MSPDDTPSPQEQEFDRAFAAKLAEFPVPADLEAKLLALGKTVLPAEDAEPQLAEIIRPSAFKRYWPLAAAATVALVLGVGSLIIPSPVEFPAIAEQADMGAIYRDHMAHFANERFFLDAMTDSASEAQASLRESGAPVFASVPAGLQPLGMMGCKSIDWNGGRVGLVCFTREDGEIVHLFIADKSGFAEADLASLTSLETSRGLQTGGWSDGEYVFMLVGSEPGIEVAEYLPAV